LQARQLDLEARFTSLTELPEDDVASVRQTLLADQQSLREERKALQQAFTSLNNQSQIQLGDDVSLLSLCLKPSQPTHTASRSSRCVML
jgi:hypothetical protein